MLRLLGTVSLAMLAACGPSELSLNASSGDAAAPDGADIVRTDADFGAECYSSRHCPAYRPHCHAGECVQCFSNLNCHDGVCDLASHRCVECLDNGDCWDAAPICDSARCTRACTADADCSSGSLPFCEPERGLCVECVNSVQCSSGSRPVCDPDQNRCVECLVHSHCGFDEPLCSSFQGECVECLSAADCPDGKVCDLGEGECQ
jgi:Cys-rich repeat protein